MKSRLVLALILLTILPAIAAANSIVAIRLLAQAQLPISPTVPIIQTAEQLAGKSIAYWFLALAIFAIASWTWIFRWMIVQLEKQREAHMKANDRLIEHMETEHKDSAAQSAAVTVTLGEVAKIQLQTAALLKEVAEQMK